MAEWQQNELKGKTDIAYLIASHADGMKGSIEPEDIELWPLQHGFTFDHLLLDEGRVLLDTYFEANPDIGKNTQAVTVIIDKNMVIRKVGSTYDKNHDENLELILKLLEE